MKKRYQFNTETSGDVMEMVKLLCDHYGWTQREMFETLVKDEIGRTGGHLTKFPTPVEPHIGG